MFSLALSYGKMEMAKILLLNFPEVDIFRVDNENQTPLFWMTFYGQLELLELCCALGKLDPCNPFWNQMVPSMEDFVEESKEEQEEDAQQEFLSTPKPSSLVSLADAMGNLEIRKFLLTILTYENITDLQRDYLERFKDRGVILFNNSSPSSSFVFDKPPTSENYELESFVCKQREEIRKLKQKGVDVSDLEKELRNLIQNILQ